MRFDKFVRKIASMPHNVIQVPVISADAQQRKLKVRYNGTFYYVDAYPFQLRAGTVPKNIDVIPTRDINGRQLLKQNLGSILDSLYEEECEYDFKIGALRVDPKTSQPYLSLTDEYGLTHRLYAPNARGQNAKGTTITCMVTSVTDSHIVLSCPKYQEGNVEEEATEDSTGISAADFALFTSLHAKREEQFKAMNDHSMRGVWKSVIDKYPDSAHFIYELLQNADDAEATEVTIYLEGDALYFKHNGKVQFTITDDYDESITPGHINAIVGVGDSTKTDNKIGKFGVGFKAVFQYSDTPIVYGDYFKFRIDNYIVPNLISEDCPKRNPGETLFEIPFKNPQVAYREIRQKLLKMEHPLLFLKNLKSIVWYDTVSRNTRLEFRKHVMESFVSRGIRCERIIDDNAGNQSEMWLFSRDVKLTEGTFPVSVGYFLIYDDQKIPHIDIDVKPGVFCFFPTSEKFGSCFISHAPFLLVDNRQQVKNNEPVNKLLSESIVKLAADALVELRDIGLRDSSYLVNRTILKMFDLRNPWIYQDENDVELICRERLYKPFLDVIRNNELILARDRNYYKPDKVLIPQPINLAEVVQSSQMSRLFSSGNAGGDFMDNPPNSRDAEGFSFLTFTLGCRIITPENLAKALNPAFMSEQSMEWVLRLYRFLREDAIDTWSPKNMNVDRSTLCFRYAPIVKTESGTWVAPYVGDAVNVFFAGEDSSGYNVVAQEYFTNDRARDFLQKLGVKEPDMMDYIKTKILAKYQNATIPLEYLKQDLATVYEYSKKVQSGLYTDYIKEVKSKLKVMAVKSNGVRVLAMPDRVYFPTKDLKAYFAGCKEDVLFLDKGLYSELISRGETSDIEAFLRDLGVAFIPRLKKVLIPSRYELTENQRRELGAGIYSYNDREEGDDWQIDGLKNALDNNINHSLSIRLWEWLTKMNFEGRKQLLFKFHYHSYKYARCEASFITQLKESAWIFVSQRTRKEPGEIALEFMRGNTEYAHSLELCDMLGIVQKTRSLKELGATDEQQSIYEKGQEFMEICRSYGLSEKEAKSILQKEAEKKKAAERKEQERKQRSAEDDSRQEMTDYTAQDTFGGDDVKQVAGRQKDSAAQQERPQAPETQRQEQTAEEKLEEIRKKQEEDLEKHAREEQLRESLKLFPKYTKEWFTTLLTLEYMQEGDNVDTFGSKSTTITFTTVERDRDSDRIYVLKHPSRVIPLEIEQIGGLSVQFSFYKDLEDVSFGFEVASVKDFTLRLKAKLQDVDALKSVDWRTCTRATVQINNPVALVGKLSDAFKELDLAPGYDLKANLTSNISFVFGPPGTGKTTTLASRIHELMAMNEQCRILVLTPTNKACDVLTLAVADAGESSPWLGRFLTTGEERIEAEGYLVDKYDNLYEQDKCCIVTTTARLPYDGFNGNSDGMLFKDIEWDYIIIDEASMIPLAQVVYAIYRFPTSEIIIAGDPKQITPIVREHEWKDENIYKMVGLNNFANPVTEPIQFRVENLSTQYRSVPAIGEVFSRYSYGGKLKHARTADSARRLDIKGFEFMKALNFITFKVDKYDNVCGPKKLSSSNVHIYSVLLVVEMCTYMARQYAKGKNKDILRIGVICPYAAQAQMIDKLLEQTPDLPDCVEISVGTIHGFQGDQCDVVFAVFNPPKGLGKAPDKVMINNHNVVNVAISRARDYMFVVMPQKDSPDFLKMEALLTVGRIAIEGKEHPAMVNADGIEEIIFKERGYIERNTFVTSHQMANVYSKPASRYEVRIDENSVDIQIE